MRLCFTLLLTWTAAALTLRRCATPSRHDSCSGIFPPPSTWSRATCCCRRSEFQSHSCHCCLTCLPCSCYGTSRSSTCPPLTVQMHTRPSQVCGRQNGCRSCRCMFLLARLHWSTSSASRRWCPLAAAAGVETKTSNYMGTAGPETCFLTRNYSCFLYSGSCSETAPSAPN